MTASGRKSTVVCNASVAAVSLCLFALLWTAGCNSSQQAPDTRAADEAAVRKADADWVKAAQAKKADDWMAFYADDAVVLPPNDKSVADKNSIRKIIAGLVELPNLSVSWTPTKVEVAKGGDLAYMVGTYQMSFTGPDGKPVDDHGKTLEIWKKQADGGWKCIVDSWSSDLPAGK